MSQCLNTPEHACMRLLVIIITYNCKWMWRCETVEYRHLCSTWAKQMPQNPRARMHEAACHHHHHLQMECGGVRALSIDISALHVQSKCLKTPEHESMRLLFSIITDKRMWRRESPEHRHLCSKWAKQMPQNPRAPTHEAACDHHHLQIDVEA